MSGTKDVSKMATSGRGAKVKKKGVNSGTIAATQQGREILKALDRLENLCLRLGSIPVGGGSVHHMSDIRHAIIGELIRVRMAIVNHDPEKEGRPRKSNRSCGQTDLKNFHNA